MACIYQSNWGEDIGKCQLWDENIEMNGCDDKGCCICSDDPDPGYTCDSYESDNVCWECGTDLNVEECECE